MCSSLRCCSGSTQWRWWPPAPVLPRHRLFPVGKRVTPCVQKFCSAPSVRVANDAVIWNQHRRHQIAGMASYSFAFDTRSASVYNKLNCGEHIVGVSIDGKTPIVYRTVTELIAWRVITLYLLGLRTMSSSFPLVCPSFATRTGSYVAVSNFGRQIRCVFVF